jgi:hypothetical protein
MATAEVDSPRSRATQARLEVVKKKMRGPSLRLKVKKGKGLDSDRNVVNVGGKKYINKWNSNGCSASRRGLPRAGRGRSESARAGSAWATAGRPRSVGLGVGMSRLGDITTGISDPRR